jgi:hypothetical protein
MFFERVARWDLRVPEGVLVAEEEGGREALRGVAAPEGTWEGAEEEEVEASGAGAGAGEGGVL